MQDQSIDLLRDETLRLLRLEIDLLHQMQNGEGVLADDQGDEHQTFTRSSVANEIDYLQGEQAKVSDFKMVLAVVGTMKAGKSTTINAIVGSEVLPNRNRPMTALPTLIEHTPGQTEPVLELKNCKPLNDLMKELGKIIASERGDKALQSMERTNDMDDLLRLIAQRSNFKSTYKGSEKIFWFLKSLNDLVRLAAFLDIKFPFSEYTNIDDYPVISIEFAHLGQAAGQGKLALLDTPGPNEAGQQHLRKMLRDQLKKASAVLAVLDFTQLKSDADEQVRKELDDIASLAEGRMFALVNKFDQKDRNGDTAEQTRTFVAESLMKLKLEQSDVYPVSSRWGYLASRAQREIAHHGKLPEINTPNNAWVEDFGQLVLGMDWEDALQDTTFVQRGADHLWKKSNFAEPLEKVIVKAHKQAAFMTLSSATAKLADTANRLTRFLEIRNTALLKSADELQVQICSLQDDLATIDILEEESKGSAENALAQIKIEMSMTFNELADEIKKEIAEGFKEGKIQEKRAIARKNEIAHIPNPLAGFGNLFVGLVGKQQKERPRTGFGFEYDEKNPIIKLDSCREADELIRKIESGVQSVIRDGEKALESRMDEILSDFREEFTINIKSKANRLIASLNERLNRDGFIIEVDLPDTKNLSLKYAANEVLRDAVDSKQRDVTRYRRSTGAWGTICSWFKSRDWGWESYSEKEGYYEIDIDKARTTIDESITQLFTELNISTAEVIEQPLLEGIHSFFEQLTKNIESIRSDLLQSIRDQQCSQDQQVALGNLLTTYKRSILPVKRDSEELMQDVRPAGATA